MENPMQTRQIPKSEWPAFINSFSSRHQGWLVKLEVFGSDIGAQIEGQALVLEGLSNECDAVKGSTITIMAGAKPDQHVTHSIRRPTEIAIEKTDLGEDAVLSIKGEDGARTLLSFSEAVFEAAS
jgi:hypothetical protein